MVEAIASLYTPRFSAVLGYMLVHSRYRVWRYLRWFWSTSNFAGVIPKRSELGQNIRRIRMVSWFLHLCLYMSGLAIALDGRDHQDSSQLQWGLALLIAVPLVAAHVLAVGTLVVRIISWPLKLRKIGKRRFI